MAFMKKDVNLWLLILIVASILLFSGFSVYYQTRFKDISLEYKGKLEQLQGVTKELTSQKQKLNETYNLRVKAEQDRKVLDSSYKEVSNENDNLHRDNSNLQSEVTSTKNSLGEKTAQLQSTQNILAQTQSELSSVKAARDIANAEKEKYKKRLTNVCDAYTPLNAGTKHADC